MIKIQEHKSPNVYYDKFISNNLDYLIKRIKTALGKIRNYEITGKKEKEQVWIYREFKQLNSRQENFISNIEIINFLSKNLKSSFSDFEKEFKKEEIKKYIKEIITINPKQLRKFAEKYKSIRYKAIFDYIFEYSFVYFYEGKYKQKRLNKHALLKFLNIRTCLYCNRNYIFPIQEELNDINEITDIKGIKGQLDHFFPKSIYPIFALSFYNLIPSCSICNLLKLEKDPLEFNLLNPYELPKEELGKFRIKLVNTKIFNFSPRDIEEAIKIIFLKNRKDEIKTVKNIDFFHIETLYNEHKDIAANILLKSKLFNSDYLKYNIMKIFPNLKLYEIYNILFDIEVTDKKFHKKAFSKYIYDILKQIGII